MNRIMKRMALPVGAAIILGSSGFAFMASNTFAASPGAGAGSVAVSGYQVDNIHFSPCENASQNVCYVNGTVAKKSASEPDAGTVAVKFNNTGWFTCTVASDYSGPRPFTCDLRPGLFTADENTLTVSAQG